MTSVNLIVSAVNVRRAGCEYFWKMLLEASRDGGSMTLKDLRSVCDPDQGEAIKTFLLRLRRAGFIEALGDKPPHRYRICKPQRDCPAISADGKPTEKGRAQQHMWNVMRRARYGFTIEQLMIDASTDDVVIGHETARSYVRLLVRAGIVKITREGTSINDRDFVLTGSGNTGAKAPRRMRAAFMYDPNTCTVLGEVVAEEDRS